MRRSRVVAGAALVLLAVVGGWLLTRRGLPSTQAQAKLSAVEGQRLLEAVMNRVQQNWVDSLSADELYRRAALGLIDELGDPNSAYLPPDRLRRLREVTSGSYRGVGMNVDTREGWITVMSLRSGSPADRAGIQSGDRLVEVNGQSVKGWSVSEASNALRGPIGSRVSLVVERRFGGARVPLTLVRTDIHVSSVQRAMMLDARAGYFSVTSFTDSTAREVAGMVDSLTKTGMTSLVLDLRGNPGGLLAQGVAVADLFLDRGQRIVSTKGRLASSTTSYVDDVAQRWPHLAIVVIVNGNTASAAEIVAGALQDHDRAIVIGRPSYGKGSAQSVIPLDSGAALKLTNARWFTPAGRSIERPHLRGADALGTDTLRPRFKTDRGRIVEGGGGIIPDLLAGEGSVPPNERRWVEAVGARLTLFRDVLASYVAQVAPQLHVKDPEFVVTAELREGLWRAMSKQGLTLSRDVYDDARDAIDRVLGREIARELFGFAGEQRRIVRGDLVISKALSLLSGVTEPEALFDRVAKRGTVDTSGAAK